LHFDHGSHRLHPATDTTILNDIKALLGQDLLDRPRSGRIRLMGRFVRFPLTLFDSLSHLPPSFLTGIVFDLLKKPLQRRKTQRNTFDEFLLHGLGRTICKTFYFPYAEKLWGLPLEKISADHATRRVSQNTIAKMIRRVMRTAPGDRQASNRFFYPRRGFGQICTALARAVEDCGGMLVLSTTPEEIRVRDDNRFQIIAAADTINADFIFSTIPVHDLVTAMRPRPGPETLSSSASLRYRGMVLYYLVLEADRFTPFDCHYFPERDVIFSRVSEPKNYSGSMGPSGLTGLCVEIPCWVDDETWNAPDDHIGAIVMSNLLRCGLPVTSPVKAAFTKRLSHAYPVYDLDYRRHLQAVDDYFRHVPNLIRFGRQAIFIHDNIHHAFEMGYAAALCLGEDGRWDADMWDNYTRRFQTFTVED